jgi:hypothetical protein
LDAFFFFKKRQSGFKEPGSFTNEILSRNGGKKAYKNLPARSGYILWMSGKRRSPNICFCSCGGAAASILAVSGSYTQKGK